MAVVVVDRLPGYGDLNSVNWIEDDRQSFPAASVAPALYGLEQVAFFGAFLADERNTVCTMYESLNAQNGWQFDVKSGISARRGDRSTPDGRFHVASCSADGISLRTRREVSLVRLILINVYVNLELSQH